MRIIIKYSHWYPRLWGLKGIVYYPFVLIAVSKKEARKNNLLKHEWIHVKQIRRDGFLYFYFRYFFEFVVGFFRYWNVWKAYRNISYEKEAYAKEGKIRLGRELE
ncbi:hypothetical protein J4462_04205 [Candidatus Pacearchaeota archaeon]|nr:hypothetical protein [Candidatus Pacearchaeota archaeon]